MRSYVRQGTPQAQARAEAKAARMEAAAWDKANAQADAAEDRLLRAQQHFERKAAEGPIVGPPRKLGGPGRPPGRLNAFTLDVKNMILGALEQVGGIDYLARQAEQNPVAFMGLVGKVLPMQVTGANGGPIEGRVEHVIVFRAHEDIPHVERID